MSRSHPPSLLTTVRRTLVEESGLVAGARVLVAVSGGGDSQALLDTLARVGPRLGLELLVQGVDHGLRSEAGAELDLARSLAERYGLPFGITRLAVPRGSNLQARARAARLEALRAAASRAGAEVIATGHHAEDRAETLLIRLLRGSGPGGLAVLPVRDGDRLRPLVRAHRSAILSHLSRHGIPFASDPSNRDPRFLRVRVRTELLPLLEELSPRIVEHLGALADQSAAPDPCRVIAEALAGAPLGRAQRQALERAVCQRREADRIWLAGDRVAHFEPGSGRLTVDPSGRDSAPRRRGGADR